MAREYAVPPFEDIPVPPDAHTFEGFLRWVESDGFPETGRIDFLAGEVEAEMSPEDLHTHSVVKTAIGLTLGNLIYDTGLGDLYVDSTRLTSKQAGLSAEPDLFIVRAEARSTRIRCATPGSMPWPVCRNCGSWVAAETRCALSSTLSGAAITSLWKRTPTVGPALPSWVNPFA